MGQDTQSYTVGQKLRALRLERGFTSQASFAYEIGMQPKQYWRLEEDKSDMKLSTLKRILDYYQVKPELFFQGTKL